MFALQNDIKRFHCLIGRNSLTRKQFDVFDNPLDHIECLVPRKL